MAQKWDGKWDGNKKPADNQRVTVVLGILDTVCYAIRRIWPGYKPFGCAIIFFEEKVKKSL